MRLRSLLSVLNVVAFLGQFQGTAVNALGQYTPEGPLVPAYQNGLENFGPGDHYGFNGPYGPVDQYGTEVSLYGVGESSYYGGVVGDQTVLYYNPSYNYPSDHYANPCYPSLPCHPIDPCHTQCHYPNRLPSILRVPTPISIPVPSPISIPIPNPISIPVPAPISIPVPNPISIPVPAPISIPVPNPISIPVPAPISIPVPSPIPPPIYIPNRPSSQPINLCNHCNPVYTDLGSFGR